MIPKKARSILAIVVSVIMAGTQTMGDWNVGILKAGKRAAENHKAPEPGGNGTTANKAPTISQIVDRIIPKNVSVIAKFRVQDSTTPASELKVSASSDHPDFLANERIQITGEGEWRTLTTLPVEEEAGMATVTVTVSDKEGLTGFTRFTVSVKTELPYVPGDIFVRYRKGAELGVSSLKSKGGVADIPVSRKALQRSVGFKSAEPIFRKDDGNSDQQPSTAIHGTSWRIPPGGEDLAAKSLDSLQRTVLVKVDPHQDMQNVVEEYQRDADAESAELNLVFKYDTTPNDAYYTPEDMWGLYKIQVEKAWEKTQGQGIVVAVLDSGFEVNHFELAPNLWRAPGEIAGNSIDDDRNGFVDDVNGWNFKDNDNNLMDTLGHGTHTSGTIAAVGENGRGVIGVSYKSKIMCIKVLHLNDVIRGLRYAADNGADVVSMSLSYQSLIGCTGTIVDALNYAYGKGLVLVASAGNNRTTVNVFLPGSCPNVIAVSASDRDDRIASFSNYGLGIDVAAPGVDILSTTPDGFGVKMGTSMACPHVAGLAALILSQFSTLSNDQVRQLIRSSADDLGAPGFDEKFGYGRINAAKALGVVSVTKIKVKSFPSGARIWLSYKGGAMTDTGQSTPFEFEGKPEGAYQVKLVKSGYGDWYQTQSLIKGGGINYVATLGAAGSVAVNSTPKGADILYSVDGVNYSAAGITTNFTFNNIPAGSYFIKLVKAGFRDWYQKQSFPQGGSTSYDAVLSAPDSIAINSEPPEAKILYSVDGTTFYDSGVATPFTFLNIPAGSYYIRLQKERFLDWNQTVTLTRGGTASVDATLYAVNKGVITVASTAGVATMATSFEGGEWQSVGDFERFTFDDLTPGHYRIRLVKEGYDDWLNEIDLKAGDNITLTAEMEPTLPTGYGTIGVKSNYSGAIYTSTDGVKWIYAAKGVYANNPDYVNLEGMPVGNYKVKLWSGDGDFWISDWQTLHDGETIHYDCHIALGTVAVRSNLPALIWTSTDSVRWFTEYNNTFGGDNYLNVVKPVGKYWVKLTLSGFEDWISPEQEVRANETSYYDGHFKAGRIAVKSNIRASIYTSTNSITWERYPYDDVDDDGSYVSITDMPVGNYWVKLSAYGFPDWVSPPAAVLDNQTTKFDGHFSVGTIAVKSNVPARIWTSTDGVKFVDSNLSTVQLTRLGDGSISNEYTTIANKPMGNYWVKLKGNYLNDYISEKKTLASDGEVIPFDAVMTSTVSIIVVEDSGLIFDSISLNYNSSGFVPQGQSAPHVFYDVLPGTYEARFGPLANYTFKPQVVAAKTIVTFGALSERVRILSVFNNIQKDVDISMRYHNSGEFIFKGNTGNYQTVTIVDDGLAGNREIKFSKTGFEDAIVPFTWAMDDWSKDIRATAELATIGNIIVENPSPAGAMGATIHLYISGASMPLNSSEVTPHTFTHMTARNYKVVLKKAGYNDYTYGDKTLALGGTVTFPSVAMTPK